MEAARARHEADREARAQKRQERAQRRQERLAKAVDELGAVAVSKAELAKVNADIERLEAAAARPPEVREVVKERPLQPPSPTVSKILDDWAELGIQIPPELRRDGDAAGHAIRLAKEMRKAGEQDARAQAATMAAEAARARREAEEAKKRAQDLERERAQQTELANMRRLQEKQSFRAQQERIATAEKRAAELQALLDLIPQGQVVRAMGQLGRVLSSPPSSSQDRPKGPSR